MLQKHAAFYLLLITQTLSLIGSRLTAVGMGIWVFQTTGSTTPLLLTLFFNELPAMLFGSLAGVLIDRWDRRKVLVLADSGQAFGSLVLIASLLTGSFTIWLLYLVAFVQGTFSTLQQPTEDAVIPLLVPPGQLDRANGIRQMAFPLASTAATALAGILFVATGITGILLIDLATYFIAVAALWFVQIPQPPVSEEGQQAKGYWLHELLSGFRYLTSRRVLCLYLLYLTFINFLLNGPLSLDIPYLLLRTGNEQAASSLLALMNLGALAGAILTTILGQVRRRVLLQLGSLLLCGVMFLVFGMARAGWLLGAALLVLMIPLPMGNALTISLLQSKTPADMHGRIFATFSQLSFLGSTISFLLTGRMVDAWLEPAVSSPGWQRWALFFGSQPGAGIGLLLFVTGLLMLAATLIMLAVPAIRRMDTSLPDIKTVNAQPEGKRG
jgi:MFS family permease